jgi:hypothetical protein
MGALNHRSGVVLIEWLEFGSVLDAASLRATLELGLILGF